MNTRQSAGSALRDQSSVDNNAVMLEEESSSRVGGGITITPRPDSSGGIFGVHGVQFTANDRVIGHELFATYLSKKGGPAIDTHIKSNFEYPIQLFGDEFIFTSDAEGCYIFHKNWAMMGEGKNFSEAKTDLLRTIRDLRGELAHTAIEKLDARTIEYRDYLLSHLNV